MFDNTLLTSPASTTQANGPSRESYRCTRKHKIIVDFQHFMTEINAVQHLIKLLQ